MKLGTFFFLGASAIFLASGIWYGFREIQIFGYLLAVIAMVLGVQWINKRRKYGK